MTLVGSSCSGAKVWLADMEDASTPAWANVVEGQLNPRDSLSPTIDFTSRSQVWQWLHNDIVLADTAEVVTRELVERIVDEEIAGFGLPHGLELTTSTREILGALSQRRDRNPAWRPCV